MRTPITTSILLASCFFLLSACGTDTRYYAVRNHKPLVSTLGFSITPPPGDNWYESHQDESLLFLKLGKCKTYSLTTKATELVLDKKFARQMDFMNYVKKIKSIRANKKRLSNARTIFSWSNSSNSPYCVRYQQNYEDHGLRNLRDNDYVKVKNIGLVCMHPETPEVGIDISYREKYIVSANPPSYQDEGEKFIGSLTFYHKKN